jgi:hypothetical protein
VGIRTISVQARSLYSPTTIICACAVAVENDGESAVTSHEKVPERPKPTFLITACVPFDAASCKMGEKNTEKYYQKLALWSGRLQTETALIPTLFCSLRILYSKDPPQARLDRFITLHFRAAQQSDLICMLSSMNCEWNFLLKKFGSFSKLKVSAVGGRVMKKTHTSASSGALVVRAVRAVPNPIPKTFSLFLSFFFWSEIHSEGSFASSIAKTTE